MSRTDPPKLDCDVYQCAIVQNERRSTEAALAEAHKSEERLREAIDLLPEGIVFLDSDGRYILWNRKYEDIYQGSADMFRAGARLADVLRIGVARGEYPDAIGREDAWLEERLTKLRRGGQRHEQWLADGRCILIEEQQTRDGGTIGLRVDITEMKEQERSLRFLFEGNPLPMLVCDRVSGEVVSVNEAAVASCGSPPEAIKTKRFQDMLATRNDLPWASLGHVDELTGTEVRMVMNNGELREFALYARAVAFSGRDCVLLAMVDVTDRVRAEAHIAHLRDHDALTALPNRHAFESEIATRLERRGRHAEDAAVICLDIDNFKLINEAHGHALGDTLLKQIAARLKSQIRSGVVLARIGGNEFAVSESGSINPAQAEALARRLVACLDQPFKINGQTLMIAASAGIALTPTDGATPQELLKHADLALAGAKRDGSGSIRFFESQMNGRAQKRRETENALRAALAAGVLEPWYQPVVDLREGKIMGFEALVRWPQPDGKFVPPSEFIPVAEETGLIGKVSELVLRRACLDAMAWPAPVFVAVNLSPLQFRSGTLLATVMDALRVSKMPAKRLILEITETVLMERSESVVATLHALRAMGVRISLDDFGTGFSSLSYLRSFPFDKIKIDRSFVSNVIADPGQQTIVQAVIGLGRGLGMQVIAEGIETRAERDWLVSEGCLQGQGYLYSAARPQAEVLNMLGVADSLQVA